MSTLLSMVFAGFLALSATFVATEEPGPILSEAAAPVSSPATQAQALDKTAAPAPAFQLPAVAVSAQSQVSPTTFSASTELVSVPVVVKDSQGRHVLGLSDADFRIYENGHQQVIRNFEAITETAAGSPVANDLALSRAAGNGYHGALGAVILFFDQLQNMRSVAQETGGELCNSPLQAEACVRSAEQDAREFYLLTYATHSRQRRPEWRTIHVTVQRPEVKVFARTGVLIETHPDPTQEKREQIQAALLSPVEFSALRLDALLPDQDNPGRAITVSVVMRADAQRPPVWSDSGVNFTVAGVVLQGIRVVQRFGEDVQGLLPLSTERELERDGLAWSKRISLLSSPSTLRLVVRDNNTGRLGSVTKPLPARTTAQ